MIKLPDRRQSTIQFLVSHGYPELFAWPKRRADRRLSAEQLSDLQRQAKQFRQELDAKTDAELGSLYAEVTAKAAEEARSKAEREEAARPYNQPNARADVEHWAKMSYWTPDEAVALSLGREPEVANWPMIQQLARVSPFASQFKARREIVIRAKSMGQLWDKTIPAVFLSWAERMQFSMPSELIEAVKALGTPVADWKALFEEQKELREAAEAHAQKLQESHMESMRKHTQFIKDMQQKQDEIVSGYTDMLQQYRGHSQALEAKIAKMESDKSADGSRALGARERESLLKLVIGMAIGGYAHDPNATRTDTASTVASDLQRAGLSLDEDTIRKYLTEGKERLPGSETE